MAAETLTKSRWIKDPLFSVVKKFLTTRKGVVEQEGNLTDRLLADYRYSGMEPADFIIETPDISPEGIRRVCFTRRNKTFARVDMEFEPLRLKTIFSDFSVPYVTVATLDDFIAKFKKNQVQDKLLYLTWRDTMGICVNNADLQDLQKTNELFGDIFFKELALERIDDTTIDPVTLTSGVISVTDLSCTDSVVHAFVVENVVEELGLNKIQHNFPTTYTVQRGETIRHLMKFTLADEDVAGVVGVTFSSANGYVDCSLSDNKLEAVFNIIRGSATENLTDTITVTLKYDPIGDVSRKVNITFNILKDTESELKLEGFPVTVNIPRGQTMGIIVKGRFQNQPVTLSQAPQFLTTMLAGVALQSQGAYRGGILYLAVVNPSVQVRPKDLMMGNFSYQSGISQYTAKAFIDMTYLPQDNAKGKLGITKLSPNGLPGEIGKTGFFNFVTNLNGVDLETALLDYPLGVMGPNKLLQFTSFADGKVYFTFVKDSGVPGTIITDTVEFPVRYINALDGLVSFGAAWVFPNVSCPSILQLVPLNNNPISVGKYDKGAFPFKFIVNDDDRTKDMLGSPTIKSTKPYIKTSLIPTIGGGTNTDWQCLETGESKEVIDVEFEVSISADNTIKRVKGVKQFIVSPWTGSTIGCLPKSVDKVGREGDTVAQEYHFFENAALATSRINYIPGKSKVPAEVEIATTGPNGPYYFHQDHKLKAMGSVTGDLVFSLTDGNTPADSITIPAKWTIQPAEEVYLEVEGITQVKPGLNGSIRCELSYLGTPIPLTDSRVTVKLIPKGTYGTDIAIGVIGDHSIGFSNKANPLQGVTNTYSFDVEVSFIDQFGVEVVKTKVADIQVRRAVFTTAKMDLYTQPVHPNVVDQYFRIYLFDADNDPIQFATLESVVFASVKPVIGPIQSYRNQMTLPESGIEGNYDLKATTNHYGGEFNIQLKVRVGGQVVTISERNGRTFIANPAPTTAVAADTGNAVLNVVSSINFTIKQHRLGQLNAPVVMTNMTDLNFNQGIISDVTLFTMVDTNGNYRMSVKGTGLEGDVYITFKINQEVAPGVFAEYPVAVTVTMVRK
jgi:hypothetical protein